MLSAEIDCSLSLPEEQVLVIGDEERLGRVLVNLLGNAVKFTEPEGRIDISLEVQGACAVLAVRDTGIGVPPEEQGQLFDRFFRSRIAHERATQGSGLGLSIARAIVESHGGVIDMESGHGVGSTFRVRLPLEGADPVPGAARPGRGATASSVPGQPGRASYGKDETSTPADRRARQRTRLGQSPPGTDEGPRSASPRPGGLLPGVNDGT